MAQTALIGSGKADATGAGRSPSWIQGFSSGSRRLDSLMASAVLGAALVVGGATAANAGPHVCTAGSGGSGSAQAWALCKQGLGMYKVVTKCDVPWGRDYSREGAWENVGTKSVVYCNGHVAYGMYVKYFGE